MRNSALKRMEYRVVVYKLYKDTAKIHFKWGIGLKRISKNG